MRLGGEIHDGVGLGGKVVDQGRVVDVAMHELEAWVLGHLFEIREVPGIGELVEHHDVQFGIASQHLTHECRADEPGTAGHEQLTWSAHGRTVRGSTCSGAPTASGPTEALLGTSAAKPEAKLLAARSDSTVPASCHSPANS